jgi:proteasome lid subunit RPN8/RPN11
MIRIDDPAWKTMLAHAIQAYPRECCGIILGREADGGHREVSAAVPCVNAYEGDQSDRFLIDPKDQIAADRRARNEGIDVLGFFHSHPDHDVYFSETDLKNSWPWYSNIVLSIREGRLAGAGAFRADDAQTVATPEELIHP